MVNMSATRSSKRIAEKYKSKPFIARQIYTNKYFSDSSSDEECSNSDSQFSTPRKTKSKLYDLEVSPPKQSKLETPRNIRNVKTNVNTPTLENLSLVSPTKDKSARKSLFAENEYAKNTEKWIVDTSSSKEDTDEDEELLRSRKNIKSTTNTQNASKKRLYKENDNNKKSVAKPINKKCIELHLSDQTNDEGEIIPKNRTAYQCARQALHGTLPSEMPGREKELQELRTFIEENIKNKFSASLYVSGPPGTGKTASLNTILKEKNLDSSLTHVYVNCTAIKSPSAIYSRIIKELNLKPTGKTEKDHLSQIDTYLRRKHKPILLILDEIDQLETKNQSILYTIFEWPSKPNSQILLIGIANALDLTDRILPRLQARCELKPQLMHFAPYTKSQIIEIFTTRLRSAGVLEIFSPVAVQMLAGKVAAVSGDVRRALDIGRRVIELVDQSRRTDALRSVENLANQLIEEETKAVDLKQVLSVLNNVYGTSQNLTDNSEVSFPLQQKIILCSLLLMLKKNKSKDITVGKLHEVYRRVCDKRKIGSVDQAEFVGLCSLIETKGIISIGGKKEPRLNKVSLMWDEQEVTNALRDKQLISEILQDESCLGKF